MRRSATPNPARPSLDWRWSGAAILFDLDGTLVDSTASVVRAWEWVAAELDRPYAVFEPYAHGIPAAQVFAEVAGDVPATRRDELIESMLRAQAEDTDGVLAIPGALAALDALPTARWAIVTSGDLRLATARIRAAGLPLPRVLVTADDVVVGKPHPAPYLLGASRLGAEPARCLVVEDAPAGVAAGRAAGMTVLGVLGSVGVRLEADALVADLEGACFAADRFAATVELARP